MQVDFKHAATLRCLLLTDRELLLFWQLLGKPSEATRRPGSPWEVWEDMKLGRATLYPTPDPRFDLGSSTSFSVFYSLLPLPFPLLSTHAFAYSIHLLILAIHLGLEHLLGLAL